MASKLRFLLILTALFFPLFSVIASDQPQAKENERYSWPPGEAVTLSMDIEYLRQAANSSEYCADSQVELGRYYFNSNGIEAFKWFKKASEKLDNDPFGTAEAYKGLGWCYKEGKGVEKDQAEAEKWFHKAEELDIETRKAAESGDAKAQVRLAQYYDERDNHTEAFKWFKKASENIKSDQRWVAAAYTGLGFCYKSGRGVEKDQSKADALFRKGDELEYKALKDASEKGDAESQYSLGEAYFGLTSRAKPDNSMSETEAKAVAIRLFRKSAENGFAKAQNELGKCYERGVSVSKDETEAVKWFRKAANQGYPEAQKNLGYCYSKGMGVEKNLMEAANWYRKAAEQGNDSAQYFLGRCYEDGEGVPIDKVEAVNWFRKGAEQGDQFSQNSLALCYAQGIGVKNDNVKALEWFQKAVTRYPLLGFNIGYRYFEGRGVEKNTVQAVNFFQKAAEFGDANAQFYLGLCYAEGKGVEKNQADAAKWFRKAAEQGDNSAQYFLGWCYTNAEGVSVDKVEAVKWFRKAAEQGNQFSQKRLGECYAQGIGVKKDLDEAIKWLGNAAAQGNQEAKDALEKLLKDKQPKLALLIANSNYSHLGGLARTIPDAKALANVLNSMGFEVYLLKDGSREQILDALKSFENKVRGTNALAFFHFGGHGIQVEGKNYLIPADAEIPDERRVTTRAVDLDEVIATLESAKPKASVLVVDACRHNPLPATATRSATRGLAVVGRKPKNSVIIFAAEAGNEALDGLFTPVFAKALSENRDKSLNQIMQKVRSEVFNRSNGTQTPGEYNQLFDDVYLYKVN